MSIKVQKIDWEDVNVRAQIAFGLAMICLMFLLFLYLVFIRK